MMYFVIEPAGCMVEAENVDAVPGLMGYDSMEELCEEFQMDVEDIEEISKDDYDNNELYDAI